MAPMFHGYCYEASRGTQPDFILNANKNFHLMELRDSPKVDPTSNLINRFPHRISSIQIDKEGFLLNILNKNAERFSHLTSLDLANVSFRSTSLLIVAPQLEQLKLDNLKTTLFDISTVDEDSECFSKLKTLELINIDIDVKKVLDKCCNTLKYFKCIPFKSINNLRYLENSLSSIQYLHIVLNHNDSEEPLKNLLLKCSGSLKTLNLEVYSNKIDMSDLLEQALNITSLYIYTPNPRKKSKIHEFLNKCPLVQKLTLTGYNKEINLIVLKDLKYLKLNLCCSKCMTSLLKQESESSLRTVDIIQDSDVLMECEFPVISKLDKILVHKYYNETEDMYNQVLDKVVKLFPSDAEVRLISSNNSLTLDFTSIDKFIIFQFLPPKLYLRY